MKKIFLLILVSAIVQYLHSQHIINTNGRYINNDTFSISYSIGDISIATFHNNEYIVDQGFIINEFHDVYSPPVGVENNSIYHSINVYPNPVIDFLMIESNICGLKYRLINIYGANMANGILSGNKFVISMKYFPQSVYILQLSENNKPVKSYTIIKK